MSIDTEIADGKCGVRGRSEEGRREAIFDYRL